MPLLKERFMSKVYNDKSGCWLWTDAVSTVGYGYLGVGGRAGRKVQAHRISYELFKGEIPDKMHIDHLCRVRRYVNPDHLEAVTQRENLLRGKGVTARNAAVTHCPQGHEYNHQNTQLYKGHRLCRMCSNIRRKTRHERDRRIKLSHF